MTFNWTKFSKYPNVQQKYGFSLSRFSRLIYFRSESPVTEATTVIDVTEDDEMVTTFLPQQDVSLTLPDSSDKIKPQNIEKAVFHFDLIL